MVVQDPWFSATCNLLFLYEFLNDLCTCRRRPFQGYWFETAFSVVLVVSTAKDVMEINSCEDALAARVCFNSTLFAWPHTSLIFMMCSYVNGISAILSSSVPVIAGLLSPLYFQYFMDKVLYTLH